MARGGMRRSVSVLVAGGIVLPALAALSQEVTTGTSGKAPPRLVFTLKTGLNSDTNRSLSLTGSDPATTLDTNAGLTYATRTRDESFTASVGGLLRFGNAGKGTGGGSGLQEPQAKVDYSFDNGDTSLSLGAYYRKSQVSLLEPLTLATGGLSPGDLVATTGSVVSSGMHLGLEARKRAAVGVLANLGFDRRHYLDNTNPAVFDSRTVSASTGLRFHIDAARQLDLTLGYSAQTYDNAARTRTDTRQLGLSYSQTMRDGAVSAILQTSNDNLGGRNELQIGRTLALSPDITLAAQGGVSIRPGTGAQPVGSLKFGMKGDTDTLLASLSRQVTLDSTNTQISYTSLSLGYTHKLSPVSHLDLNVTANQANGSSSTVDRQNLTAAYTYQVTPDWSLNTGYMYRHLNASSGRATSNSVFFSIGRSFTLLP